MAHSPRAPALAVLIAAGAPGFASSMSMSCGDKSKHAGCKTDKDCDGNKAGPVCAENTCVECNTDAQCKDGKHCSAHACIAKAQCEHDDQCAAGQVCQAGACKACATDGDCGPGGTCSAGMCERPKKCA